MKMLLRYLFPALSILLLIVAAQSDAQTPQRDDRPRAASIGGRVTVGGAPAANALVMVTEVDPQSRGVWLGGESRRRAFIKVRTDSDGRYRVAGLAEGDYMIHALSRAYVSSGNSSAFEVFRSVTLDEGKSRDDVNIALVRGGVITGRVTDETGEPLVGVTVKPHRLRDPEGKPALSSVESLDLGVGGTDDRGIYLVFGLRPGVYIVSIGGHFGYSPDYAQVWREAPIYYPSATRDTATEINLRAGEEVSGIDIRHRSHRGRIVGGVVSGEVESSPHNSVGITMMIRLAPPPGTRSNARSFASKPPPRRTKSNFNHAGA